MEFLIWRRNGVSICRGKYVSRACESRIKAKIITKIPTPNVSNVCCDYVELIYQTNIGVRFNNRGKWYIEASPLLL